MKRSALAAIAAAALLAPLGAIVAASAAPRAAAPATGVPRVAMLNAAMPEVAVPAAAASAASCAVRWGSRARHHGLMVGTKVRDVRAGQHLCFDRLVVDLGIGHRPGFRVQYVPQIIADGSGKVIPVRGRAKLLITILAPAARSFPLGSRHLVNVTGFRAFRQVVAAGSFEGITSIGVGVRARLPFRVFTILSQGGRSRLVVDVADNW